MTPQSLVVIQGFLVFVAGIFASRGIISKDTVDWLGGPDALAVMSAVCGAALLGAAWWKTRPKALIAAAGKALDGKGAIIAPAPIADSTATPANVVKSLDEAAMLPGVPVASKPVHMHVKHVPVGQG